MRDQNDPFASRRTENGLAQQLRMRSIWRSVCICQTQICRVRYRVLRTTTVPSPKPRRRVITCIISSDLGRLNWTYNVLTRHPSQSRPCQTLSTTLLEDLNQSPVPDRAHPSLWQIDAANVCVQRLRRPFYLGGNHEIGLSRTVEI